LFDALASWSADSTSIEWPNKTPLQPIQCNEVFHFLLTKIIMTNLSRKPLLTKREARTQLKVSNGTFHNMLNKGIIKPGISLGPRMKRWPAEEIEAIIETLVAERDQKLAAREESND
jgi:predicted DNA-binding transcriptional regulator AlpA